MNDSSSKSSIETKPDASPQLPKKSITNSTLTSTGSSEAPVSVRAGSPLLPPNPVAVFPSLVNSTGPQPGEQVEGRLVTLWSVYAGRHPGAEGLCIQMSVESRAGFLVLRVPDFVWLRSR